MSPFREDMFNDECGIFGIYGHPEASNLAYLGLYSLQHRGQESSGIVSTDGKEIFSHKGMGLVADVFTSNDIERLHGNAAIGHVRYSTAGESHIRNAQPFVVEYSRGGIAVAHNGNIVNAALLKAEFEAYGSIFQSSMDTEIIVHLLASSKEDTLVDRIAASLKRVRGSYSLLFLTNDAMIAVRDPHGFRPLSLGRHKGAWVVASETCAFDLIEAEYVRDIDPGEIVLIDKNGLTSYKPFPPAAYTPCVFEFIYFARPDSRIFGANVHAVRKRLGARLALEHPVEADIVVPVPDSGVPAAIGYAEASGIPFDKGIVRNHYVGRTFIEPKDSIRHFGVKIKLNAIRDIIEGKRVVVIDDSIVRGTTSRKIIKMIRSAGAREVHMRISSPPTICPCYYGIDTPSKEELIAAVQSTEAINRYITSDTLGYLSVEGLYDAVRQAGGSFCDACFTGKYPVDVCMKPVPQLALFK
ncbi:MAG TPA: amidophosphoribosyltransferase [Deltaproteobacteria bacterium]|nr:MAG: amidophosphoribosyltransferase [Deltaproteobacteria bacterium GWA2_55_82]OGQ63289.1 MAG: amidophosphoribosyltransferase [Deltaproteobacteria bacterium RIFCSPLOWO2_02_FULL_55_12]OIJ73125.1 MAG: amidophosphoribosyltransferase [Deltaproteobacteria bacterium GWC2_55_46]HBG47892.1 amidophosphoribosyltransferase [Deltaproteobacteria bacterium]HCY11845.1 amidophosphoribosyltransferase [Deltaproteobacteria bacterium]